MPQEQSLSCSYCGDSCAVGYGFCHCGCKKETKIIPETTMSRGLIKGEPHKYLCGHGRYKERLSLPNGMCICGKMECHVPFGFCHCGCNEKTRVSRSDDRTHGYIRGYPREYIHFHGNPASPRKEDAKPFKIDGVYCRVVELSQGLWAIVDQEDYDRVTCYRWHADWNPRLKRFYAVTNVRVAKNVTRLMPMHRLIMGLDFSDKRVVDHKERLNTLDNRKANLRIATQAQNRMNSKIWGNNKCGFKGVFWNKQVNKYQAGITVDGHYIYLGRRNTAEEAFQLYCDAVKEYFGEFGRTDESCITACAQRTSSHEEVR